MEEQGTNYQKEMDEADEALEIQVIQGVEGKCLVINDYRVSGPKPWGGGTVIDSWTVPIKGIPALRGLLGDKLNDLKPSDSSAMGGDSKSPKPPTEENTA